MNRPAPIRLDALLVVALLGLMPQLPGRADAAFDHGAVDRRQNKDAAPVTGLVLGDLAFRLPPESLDAGIAAATAGARQPFDPAPGRYRLDRLSHHGGWRLPDHLSSRGLVFDAGPQLQTRGSLVNRLADELSGRNLADRHSYALIGFAGYRDNRGWAVGPEAWVNADPSYRIRGLGLAVRDLRAGPLRIDLRLGATRRLNQGQAINGGLEFRWYKP